MFERSQHQTTSVRKPGEAPHLPACRSDPRLPPVPGVDSDHLGVDTARRGVHGGRDRLPVRRPGRGCPHAQRFLSCRDRSLLASFEVADDEEVLALLPHAPEEADALAVGREADRRSEVRGALPRRAAERGHLEEGRQVRLLGFLGQVVQIVAVRREAKPPDTTRPEWKDPHLASRVELTHPEGLLSRRAADVREVPPFAGERRSDDGPPARNACHP